MQNKLFKGVLIGTGVAFVLYELITVLLYAFGYVGLLFGSWSYRIQDAFCVLMQLVFIATGVLYILAYRKHLPAVFGGAVLSLYGVLRILQVVLFSVFYYTENYEYLRIVYSFWPKIILALLLMTAFLLIAIHYKNTVMIILSVVFGFVEIMLNESIRILPFYDKWGILITGILSLIVILSEVAFLGVWIWKEVKNK